MTRWQDRYWNSVEGVRLHYRDYPGPADQPPILCLPGLTRNARDFETVADRFAGEWRVIAVDFRGRGMSDFDPQPERYAYPFFVADVLKLLDQLGIADAVFVGTSLGGIVTMLLAATDSERIAGALLNDIGPVIEREGLEFIARYLGKERSFASWDEAAAEIAESNADRYPRFTAEDWKAFARRLCDERDGTIRFAYDMRIVDNFHVAMAAPPVDAWPYFRALAGRPVTIVRGELSDLLSRSTAERMVAELPEAELVTVPQTGHAPTLGEPESIAALERLLKRVIAAG